MCRWCPSRTRLLCCGIFMSLVRRLLRGPMGWCCHGSWSKAGTSEQAQAAGTPPVLGEDTEAPPHQDQAGLCLFLSLTSWCFNLPGPDSSCPSASPSCC